MPATPHIEKHFTAGDTVRDVVIGMSDGLTVPFALAAGLSGAVTARMSRPTGAWMRAIASGPCPSSASRATRLACVRRDPSAPM